MIKKNTQKYIKQKKKDCLYGVNFLKVVHPGETLKDELNFWGMTQSDLAKKTGCKIQRINSVIKGVKPITINLAMKLEEAFYGHPSAQFWLNMQDIYDQGVEKQEK